MRASIIVPDKPERPAIHDALLPQVEALLAGEQDAIAAMANMAAAIHHAFGWHWVGFYRVVGNELLLGPFQGPVACSRIPFGKGVCGTAWKEGRTMVVPDVDLFPGHIACSTHSRSEVVVPVRDGAGTVVAVLDIDSSDLNDFSHLDVHGLEELCKILSRTF